jgi:hypothetical protein
MESKTAATRLKFHTRLNEIKARTVRGRGTGTAAGTAKPPEFDETTPWSRIPAPVRDCSRAEHNCWTRKEKSTYLMTVLHNRPTDVLHGVPKDATYDHTIQTDSETSSLSQHIAVS